jgi:hypothetical protein
LKTILSIVVTLISLLGGFLSISRYKDSPGENRAILFWGVVVVVVLVFWAVFLLRKLLGPWLKQYRRIRSIARSLAGMNVNEVNLDRLEDWIKRHAKERPADLHEINRVVCEAPILQAIEERLRSATMNRLRDEICNAKLIWFRWHEMGLRAFDFDFDSFRFLNPDSQETGLGTIKHDIKEDILSRFRGEQFHIIVYILRGKSNHRMGKFFEELKVILPCADFIGFPLNPVRRDRDSVLADELLNACAGGKSILLVEPLLTDNGLDEAYKTLTEWGGIVNGVVVMFEVKGIDPKKLVNYAILQQKSGQNELRGQIVLDLQSPLTEPA